ncbi:hypothetical protein CC86DRAFT_9574 [Ophiobolus disseminans]|uniref:Heterokaryon incompatibility domain-containing protein n=1 Tax=Ophiobolus disseminans TaxID=1469910 RepID=A0A6A7AJF4_9PLEO|nr:hypothetical protein CC86DRAFT_9574 [Ophiobolus disseminans]
MAPYQYVPLDANKNQIRILSLLPGSHEDPIRISISQISFDPPERNDQETFLSDERFREIQDKLPETWSAYRTIEGRPIFGCEPDGQPVHISWQPPESASEGAFDEFMNIAEREEFEPAFEAVSYTWGALDTTLAIEVVDTLSPTTTAGTLDVGPNLFEIIHHLRLPEDARTLWIDAICINQQDLVERSKQIKNMRDIYAYARRVIVWLGPSSEDSTLALRTLEHVGKQIEFTICDTFMPAPDCTETQWWDYEERLPLASGALEAVLNLIQRPYFERLWVKQEIQFSSEASIMQCGDMAIRWYHMRRGLIRLPREMTALPRLNSVSSWTKIRIADRTAHRLKMGDIETLFDIAAECKCVDPRDRIFAILGLLPASLAQRIHPDYQSPVEQVYLQAFLTILDFTRRFSRIGCVGGKAGMRNRPSWVRDFTQSYIDNYWLQDGNLASGHSSSHTSFVAPNQLHMQGVYHGEITAVSSPLTGSATANYLAFCELVSVSLPNKTKNECLDIYTWVMTEGQLHERWPELVVMPPSGEAKAIVQQMCDGKEPDVPDVYREWFSETLMDQQQRGIIFVTSTGCIGCASPTVRPGDKVSIPLGSREPILLRPKTSDNAVQHHQVVGISYIHGLMEGQAILGPISVPWRMVIETITPVTIEFRNSQTGEMTREDPRLDPLPHDSRWVKIEKKDETRSPYAIQHYKHLDTGQVLTSDPRLLPEALRARGVNVETFILV